MTRALASEASPSRFARVGARAASVLPLAAAVALLALQMRSGALDAAAEGTPVTVRAALALDAPADGLLARLLAGPASLFGMTGQGGLIVALALVATFLWSSGFQRLSQARWSRAALVLLLIASPMWQAILAAGAGPALATVGMWVACWGLFELRAAPGAPAVMTIAMGLVAAAFADLIGAVFAGFAALFFVLAAPPAMLRRSWLGVAIALLFPLFFSAFGLVLIRWILDPASVVISPPAALLHLASDDLLLAGMAAAGALLFCTPLIATVLISRRSFTTVAPAMAVAGSAVCSAVVTVLLGHPLMLALAAASVAPAIAAAWLPSSERARFHAGAILAVGLAAGAAVASLDASPKLGHWREAVLGADPAAQRIPLPARWPEQSLPEARSWQGSLGDNPPKPVSTAD
ncbi:hypothetical protein LJR225_001354 [Phenylobacterium sp. LjRoot225]|uniref:hypothetical protein n=1 Tax=Phenylobacterium sp. LjRoot225 TaxID=3342285 RepID=UPI003ECF959E